MKVDVIVFIVGLLLLWFPRQWMRRGVALLRRRRKSRSSTPIADVWKDREPGDPRVDARVEFKKFRNYLDLLRAGAGSLMLTGGMGLPAALTVLPDAPGSAGKKVLLVRAGAMMIGLLIQTTRYEKERLTFYPPIFYLAGLSVGLCDIRGALFAFVLVWAFNPMLPNVHWFLTVYAIIVAVFGHFFSDVGDIMALYAGVLCFTPVLASTLAGRPLIAFTRRGSRG